MKFGPFSRWTKHSVRMITRGRRFDLGPGNVTLQASEDAVLTPEGTWRVAVEHDHHDISSIDFRSDAKVGWNTMPGEPGDGRVGWPGR